MKSIHSKVLFLFSVTLLASNFFMVARASGTVRHLIAYEFYVYSTDGLTFGWEPTIVVDLEMYWEVEMWAEFYPNSYEWDMKNWEDSDLDEKLSTSDYVEMENDDTGERQWFIVDRVTVAILWLWYDETTGVGGTAPPGFDPFFPGTAEFTYWPLQDEPYVDHNGALPDPLNSEWHMISPSWSRAFKITDWEDLIWAGEYGTFSQLDKFDITFIDDGTGPWHAILEHIATALVLTETEGPPTDMGISWHNAIQAIAVVEAIIIGILLLVLVKKWGGPWLGPKEPDQPEPIHRD